MSPVPATSLRSYTYNTRYIKKERKKEKKLSQASHLSSTFQLSPLRNKISPLKEKTLSSTSKMAPITRLSTPLLRSMAQRRGFSIISRVRQTARSFEPHPFERMPITQKAAPADYGKLVRHVGDAAMLCVPLLWIPLPLFLPGSTNCDVNSYFPAIAILLGWPLVAEKMLDGHVV
jgi:hypothetical protein